MAKEYGFTIKDFDHWSWSGFDYESVLLNSAHLGKCLLPGVKLDPYLWILNSLNEMPTMPTMIPGIWAYNTQKNR